MEEKNDCSKGVAIYDVEMQKKEGKVEKSEGEICEEVKEEFTVVSRMRLVRVES